MKIKTSWRKQFRLYIQVFSAILMIAAWQSAHAMEGTSRIRLLDGGRDGDIYLSALEITLDPGFLTYWRFPGEAGLPPEFDWSASKNVAAVEVLWPAPERIREADSIVYGFHKQVTIPLKVTPDDPARPVNLKLNLQYGVCKDICIPTNAVTTIELNGKGDNAVLVQRAMRNLPKQVQIGADGPLAILSVKPRKEKAETLVTVRVPDGEHSELFADGPEGWIYTASEGSLGKAAHTMEFMVKLESRPAGTDQSPPMRLTVRAETGSIETSVSVQ